MQNELKNAVQLAKESGRSIADIAEEQNINSDDLLSAVITDANKTIKRVKREARKVIRDDMVVYDLSHSIPTANVVTIEIAPKSEWTSASPIQVDVDTSQPVKSQIVNAIETLASEMDNPKNVVGETDELPIGVYDIIYYYIDDDGQPVKKRACDSNVGLAYVERLLDSRITLDGDEVAVATCQSQPGRCVIAGSQAALEAMEAQNV